MLTKLLTPMTYYYLIQSLLGRCAWLESAAQSISQPDVPTPFKLAWRTQKLWLAGKEVLQYFVIFPYDGMTKLVSGNPPLRLLILPEDQMVKYADVLRKSQAQGVMPALEKVLKGVHYIDNLQLSMTKKENGDPENIALTFLLLKEHGLTEKDCVYVIDVSSSMIVFGIGWMSGFNKLVVKNPHPFEMKPLSLPLTPVNGFQLIKCIEERDHYEMAISFQGLTIEDPEGTSTKTKKLD